MDAQALIDGSGFGQLAAALLVFAPAIFIVCSRRCSWMRKLLWATATQLPWLFVIAYWWIRQGQHVAGDAAGAPPLVEALGWWSLAFPWGIYLLYRATRARFPGETRPPSNSGAA